MTEPLSPPVATDEKGQTREMPRINKGVPMAEWNKKLSLGDRVLYRAMDRNAADSVAFIVGIHSELVDLTVLVPGSLNVYPAMGIRYIKDPKATDKAIEGSGVWLFQEQGYIPQTMLEKLHGLVGKAVQEILAESQKQSSATLESKTSAPQQQAGQKK